jgi:hypothetical protein
MVAAYNNYSEYMATYGQVQSHSAAQVTGMAAMEERNRACDRGLEAYAAACALLRRVRPESFPSRAGRPMPAAAALPLTAAAGSSNSTLSTREQVIASVQARRMEANASMCQGEAALARLSYLARLERGDSRLKQTLRRHSRDGGLTRLRRRGRRTRTRRMRV